MPVQIPAHAHGTYSGYNYYRCRECEACAQANRDHQAKDKERIKAAGIPDWVIHGRLSTYNYWGCHCDECKAASARYNRERRTKP